MRSKCHFDQKLKKKMSQSNINKNQSNLAEAQIFSIFGRNQGSVVLVFLAFWVKKKPYFRENCVLLYMYTRTRAC